MKSVYQIAGILVQVDAPNKLTDNDAFSLYRVSEDHQVNDQAEDQTDHQAEGKKEDKEDEKNVFHIRMIPEDVLQVPAVCGTIVFEDLMHRVIQTEEGILQLFRIPFMNMPSAWNYVTDGNSVEVHYLKAMESYYLDSVGCFNVAGFERVLYAFKKYLFHCSYVDTNHTAILFSAPSGGGKTTQGELWEKFEGATMINGDRGVLTEEDGNYFVSGLPIAGSSGVFINRTLPLKAIFVVKKDAENKVRRLSHEEAFHSVFSELTLNTWNPLFTLDAVDFSMKLAEKVPVYELSCTISEEAVQKAKEVL